MKCNKDWVLPLSVILGLLLCGIKGILGNAHGWLIWWTTSFNNDQDRNWAIIVIYIKKLCDKNGLMPLLIITINGNTLLPYYTQKKPILTASSVEWWTSCDLPEVIYISNLLRSDLTT